MGEIGCVGGGVFVGRRLRLHRKRRWRDDPRLVAIPMLRAETPILRS